VTAAENTISKRVPAVTGIAKPVVNPEVIVPMAMMPVSGGAKVTMAPGTGVKISLGVVDWYNCAVIVTVEPIRVSAAEILR
jgi:hypothetical protein